MEARPIDAAAVDARPPRMGRRELLVEAVGALAVLGGALALALGLEWNRALSWQALLIVVGCYAVASLVEFPAGGGWTDPTQIVFVAALFMVPAPLIPAVVIGAFLLGRSPRLLRRRVYPEHFLLVAGDSLYAFGPAVIFALAQAGDPTLGDWPIYLAALTSQALIDPIGYGVREWAAGGPPPRWSLVVGNGWAYGVDMLLSVVGLMVAIAVAASAPATLLMILPLFGLFWLFAQDRKGRIEGAIELSRAYRGTAMLLGDVVEADHAYTGQHSQNVVELSVAVAERMGLGEEQRRSVEFAALLHDVGKIAVPKEIIDKPGPLDASEWEIMKRHTIDGQRMLERVGGVLARVGGLVRSSHEHFDGSGYPDGLRGRQIPIEARVITCCDAFSAMTTDRSYRAAMTHVEAVAELRACAGTQFDPAVVRCLIEVLGPVGRPDSAALIPGGIAA